MSEIITRSRLDDQRCVKCGYDLISPKDADLGMCKQCIKDSMTAAKKQIKNRKSRTGNVKRIRMKMSSHLVHYKE